VAGVSKASLFTATDELAQVLGTELAAHFLAHRKALKKPMTPYAAQLMAKKLRGFPDPVAAVEQSILKGWCDVFPIDAQRQSIAATSARGVESLRADLARRIAEDEQERTTGTRGDDLGPDRTLSLFGPESGSRPH
jgi:hypothetical protein